MDAASINGGQGKNASGQLGPICDYCGGYGFTLSFGTQTGSAGCTRCWGEGVKLPDPRLLMAQIAELQKVVERYTGESLNVTSELG